MQAGADPSVVLGEWPHEETAFMVACEKGRYERVKICLQLKGASCVVGVTEKGLTAADLLARSFHATKSPTEYPSHKIIYV